MDNFSKIRQKIKGTELIILVLVFFIGFVPNIFEGMSASISSIGKNYGAYTLETIHKANIDDPFIEKLVLQKAYYEQYLAAKFSTVEIEETIYYLKDGLSGKFVINVENEGKPDIDIDIRLDKHKTTSVSIRLYLLHNGNFKETFAFINKEELEYVGDYFGIDNAYTLLKDNYKNLKQSDNNENSLYAQYTDDSYSIEINEFRYSSDSTIEATYHINKFY